MQDTSTGVRRGRRHKLTWEPGTPVVVTLGRGVIKRTKTTCVPFKWARSGWFVRVEGLWGAVPLSHVAAEEANGTPSIDPAGTPRRDS